MTPNSAYELFEELGRGANTVVYRSYDLSLGREVAVKELDEAGRRDPRHRERFLREAQFLAQFEHDNVLRVYSVDPDRGWIIMELMKGNLASKIAEGPIDPDLVRSILKQTLDALAFLHEKNKVHGTVRPTNLLINEAGRVKLSEFEQTAVGSELRVPTGSKKYLAPELIRPEFGSFGPPTDLYCLGFTALELLKGAQFDSLFPGTGKGAIDADVAWLRWHSSPEELPPIKKLVRGVPEDLAHVLDKMLKKNVADRAQTAQEVLAELADRPLVPVQVTADAEDSNRPPATDRPLIPGTVRTLAPGQQPIASLPRASTPTLTASASSPSPAAAKRSAKAAAAKSKTAAPQFSKDWWNQQLGRPYVLYPLCALILLGALWFTIRINSGDTIAAIPVSFNIEPAGENLKVIDGDKALNPAADGSYPLMPGVHKVTFQQDGFKPATKEIEVSQESNKFAVKLEPIIKWNDVVIAVTPPDAQLKIDGKRQTLADGSLTQKQQADQPLGLEASRSGFVSVTKTLTPQELEDLKYQIRLDLERDKPKLPDSLTAKDGAELDSDTLLPVRATSTRLDPKSPLEFVLVTPGTYTYGSSDKLREGELPRRSVELNQPLYMATNEVNNLQYQQFAAAVGDDKAGTRWRDAAKKWAEPLNLDPESNSLPVTNVSSEQAEAFSRWIGGRLPTEIEWESAVRGSQDKGYPMPWGTDQPTSDRCQIFYGELGPVPVDKLTAGASPLGLLNAIGNAAEWCRDSENAGRYILRGCSFATANIDDVRVTWRRPGDARGEEDTGLRVVIPIDFEPAQ